MSRSAFTLVELLVVIAIIGVLVALLLPAVQQAREAGRRMQCQSNMKQIGLAIHNYHDSMKVLPPSKTTDGPCCGSKSFSGWAITILPYIEQLGLQQKYDFNAYNEDPANSFVRTQFVPTYACPTDIHAAAKKKLVPESGPGNTAGIQYMTGSYRAMGGKYDGSNSKWDTGEALPMRPEWRGPLHLVARFGSVNMGYDSFSNILDGLSQTTLVAEYTTKTHINRTTYWAYSYGPYNAAIATDQARTLIPDYDRCYALGGAGDIDPCKRSSASMHPPGGLNIVMCDGSVRYILRTLDMSIWTAMATIQGDETFTLP